MSVGIFYKLRHCIGIKSRRVSNPGHGGIYVTLPGALTIRPTDRMIVLVIDGSIVTRRTWILADIAFNMGHLI